MNNLHLDLHNVVPNDDGQPAWIEHPVPSTVPGHQVIRIDAFPPFANRESDQVALHTCLSCGLIFRTVAEHDELAARDDPTPPAAR